eukprot:TRINITY_DN101124_c0_g1_i1.p1 TRINITY_DN101124_c0_g1~~TRINITY_DN101124_c0_g1_i1.p1  ORF type:complete len:1114 (+),score=426.29 TRINITY_DN101124_c0_g1_i1:133-3474(+)
MAEVAQLVKALISADNAERQQAEKMYGQTKESHPEQILTGMVSLLGTAGAEEVIRSQAAVLCRQMVSPGDEKKWVWSRVSAAIKQEVAAGILKLYEGEQNAKLQKKLGEVLQKLAVCAFGEDQKGWVTGAKGFPELLQLVFKMADCSQNPNPASCETSIRLLQDLIDAIQDSLGQAQQQLSSIIQNAFQNHAIAVKVAGVLLVCEMVSTLEKKAWAPLTSTVPVLVQILQALAQDKAHQEMLSEVLQAFTEVAEIEPDFFKAALESSKEPAQTLTMIVKARENVEDGERRLAMSWLKSYIEKKPKWLAKKLPAVPGMAIECCFELMLEVDADEDALKQWVERMDDEEGEEDADEQFRAGEEDLDGIVEAMGMDTVGQTLFAAVGKFAQMPQWQARHAALAAIKQTVEYVEEEAHVNEMAKLLMQHYDHEHPRVRYTALHATGQLANDQSPHFQEKWHKELMPQLLRKMDDPVERVASMAMSAFVSFGSELEKPLMLPYTEALMKKLSERLASSKHRMVQEECITSIAVIAGVIDKGIVGYYDSILPVLKHIIMTATGEKQGRLRGKAFECFSLLGLAVGKERFKPDSFEAIQAMLSQQLEADDLQTEYIYEAMSRFCKCLKEDFKPHLEVVLPRLLGQLNLKTQEDIGGPDDDDEEYLRVQTGDGKIQKVHTSALEALGRTLTTLQEFIENMRESYGPFVERTAEGLKPLLEPDAKVHQLYDDARSGAYFCWANLTNCCKPTWTSQGEALTQCTPQSQTLLKTLLQSVALSLTQQHVVNDCDTVVACMDGLAKCIRGAGRGALSGQEVIELSNKCFEMIDGSLKRTAEMDKAKKEEAAGLSADLQGDEDDENDGDAEENCRRQCEEAIAAIMEAAPAEFVQGMSNEVNRRLNEWLPSKQNKTLGLFLVADLLKNLKEHSQPFWPLCMTHVFSGLQDKDADVRIPAAYSLNCAAPIAAFKEAAPQAFRALAQIMAAPAPKKRDSKGKVALDNVIAAMLSLARHQSDACPPEVQAWNMVVEKLPLREDEEEARECHTSLVQCIIAQHPGIVAGDNLGKALAVLAEIHENESLSKEELDKEIVKIFKTINPDILRQMAGNFTEKQQKKIEHMITTA